MIIIAMACGFVLMVPVVMFLTLCAVNILFVDGLTVAVAVALLLGFGCGVHPVFCILAGAGVIAGMFWLYTRENGFRILTGISTVVWTYLAGFFTYDLTGGDRIWTVFIAGILGAMILGLHLHCRQEMAGFR